MYLAYSYLLAAGIQDMPALNVSDIIMAVILLAAAYVAYASRRDINKQETKKALREAERLDNE